MLEDSESETGSGKLRSITTTPAAIVFPIFLLSGGAFLGWDSPVDDPKEPGWYRESQGGRKLAFQSFFPDTLLHFPCKPVLEIMTI